MADVPLPGVRATLVARSPGTEADIIRERERPTVLRRSAQQPLEPTGPMATTTTTTTAATTTRMGSMSVQTSIHINRACLGGRINRSGGGSDDVARSNIFAPRCVWQLFRSPHGRRYRRPPNHAPKYPA